MRPTLLTSMFLCVIAFSTTANAGKIYKWVDDKGNVTFSHQKPAPDAQLFNIRSGTTKKAASTDETSTKKTKADKSKKGTKKSKEALAKEKRIKELEARELKVAERRKKERCLKLKENNKNLTVGGRMYETKDGKRTFLSGDDIKRKAQETGQQYNNECM